MKVLVLSHISELLGGAERSMLDVFDYWSAKYGVKPEFIMRLPVKGLAGELKKRGWKYHAIDYTFWSDGNPPTHPDAIYHNWRRNLSAVANIEALIKKLKPELVVTNSLVAPWAALAAYNQNVPHVWFVREYGDLDHGRVFEIGRQKTLTDVGNLSDLVVTNSLSLAEHVSKYVDKQKVTTLYNPFDLPSIAKRAAARVDNPFKQETSLKLIITGNLAASKGQLEAILAVAKLNQQNLNTELCVVGKSGDPQYRDKLQAAIKNNKLESKVHFVGYQTNPLAYVALADVGIMTSRKEAFGRTTFEYLALGKPVVGANSGATPEMVKVGINGYLFNANDVDSLAAALKHYVNKPDLIKEHGQASLARAKAMMAGPENIDALYEKVQAVANNKTRPTKQPINFFRHWEELAKTTRVPQVINDSLTIRLKRRVRRHVKTAYVRARSLKTKVTGK